MRMAIIDQISELSKKISSGNYSEKEQKIMCDKIKVLKRKHADNIKRSRKVPYGR